MIEKEVLVRLTQEEINSKTDELTSALDQLDRLEQDHKEFSADYRALIKATWERISKLTEALRTKHERRSVLCEEVPDYRDKVMRTVRQDNGQVVSTRGLTAEEMQQALFPRTENVEEPEELRREAGTA